MKFDAVKNYAETRRQVAYVPRKEASADLYEQLGFMCGLEVHQQLASKEKLFCRCPVGYYQDFDDYDAEVIRHMRPTLSELGEYDGTALMEFKTRKEIVYRLKHKTTCTYEIDDTPPFKLNQEALSYAMEIALLLNLNIVGELHIARKQYLDGSIPTGFQRTGIIGIEGEIPLKNKKVKIIQLSIEEDSCREVSDIGHRRVYTTDRLGIPLIETVTYPELLTPDEAQEAGHYIRFLARSTGKVRTGIGAGRQDVNVSIRGGTRIEIKGVQHISWIPELTHNEAFRQKALLQIKDILAKRVADPKTWKMEWKTIPFDMVSTDQLLIKEAIENGQHLIAVNLPQFKGLLSYFTQPNQGFINEISDRLKVIACLEKPNLAHSEEWNEPFFAPNVWQTVQQKLNAQEGDAQILLWAPEADIKTALETIEERCVMAFNEIPKETRKSFADGTTIFERVLPGADRMYPDTDTAPLAIEQTFIESIRSQLPVHVHERFAQLQSWDVPEDAYPYLLRNNFVPFIEKVVAALDYTPKFVATLLAHDLKHIEGQHEATEEFAIERIQELLQFVQKHFLDAAIIKEMLPVVYRYPRMEFESVLQTIDYEKHSHEAILAEIATLRTMFAKVRINPTDFAEKRWVMGQIRSMALGNMPLQELEAAVMQAIQEKEAEV